MNRLLIVDDEVNIRESLKRLLSLEGLESDIAEHPHTACELLRENMYSAILLDLRMPDMDGIQVLEWIIDRGIRTPVIMMSAHGEIQDAVTALKTGAVDYLVKPFDADELLLRLGRAMENYELQRRYAAAMERQNLAPRAVMVTGSDSSPAFEAVHRLMIKAAPKDSTILITGESGTGKEVTARTIHNLSPRKSQDFVAVNMAGISEQLLESELFGYEKGAFTGAEKQTAGIFEAAAGGTVFLDEIGEAGPSLQAKLLRVIQERKIRRVGSPHELPVDIRILAATNRDLEAMVAAGTFREDLYYRLNVVHLQLPSLRERKGEIPDFAARILEKINTRLGTEIQGISGDALQLLSAYHYPGNIRELENLIERAVILCDGDTITPVDLPGLAEKRSERGSEHVIRPEISPTALHELFQGSLKDVEKEAIAHALAHHKGNRTRTSKQLGISRKTLIQKIKDYQLD